MELIIVQLLILIMLNSVWFIQVNYYTHSVLDDVLYSSFIIIMSVMVYKLRVRTVFVKCNISVTLNKQSDYFILISS